MKVLVGSGVGMRGREAGWEDGDDREGRSIDLGMAGWRLYYILGIRHRRFAVFFGIRYEAMNKIYTTKMT